jgi:transposase InsO family protein
MSLHARDVKRYPISSLCKLFGVSKQAYYNHDVEASVLKVTCEKFVVEYIRSIRAKDPGIGGLKLWHMYRKAFSGNNPVGRDRFADIVAKHGLKVRSKPRKVKTTDSTHGLPVYPNIVKDMIPLAPNMLWVSDITYISIWLSAESYVFCYLSMILDSYTEEIVGWSVGPTLETCYPVEALTMALQRIEGRDNVQLIHHSDRGCQYASNEYISILKRHGIRISMTENGDPKENAQAERINNTMKNELLKDIVFHSIDEVKEAVRAAVEFYNVERPHMSIDMMTPDEAGKCSGEIAKRWKSYRQEAISREQKEDNTENSLPLPPCHGLPVGRSPEGNP